MDVVEVERIVRHFVDRLTRRAVEGKGMRLSVHETRLVLMHVGDVLRRLVEPLSPVVTWEAIDAPGGYFSQLAAPCPDDSARWSIDTEPFAAAIRPDCRMAFPPVVPGVYEEDY